MNTLLPIVGILSAATMLSCGKDPGDVREVWNSANNPIRLSNQYQRKLGQLPASGSVSTKPWSDTYWPSKEGGIAVRWQGTNRTPFSYEPYTEAQIREFAAREPSKLQTLSPAEKYDIAMGRFDYPTWKSERQRTSPNAPAWEGLCHGWAPAAANFKEPRKVSFTGPSGITLPFGSSDVKALLTLYQGNISQAPSRLLGARCNVDFSRNPSARNNPECRDTNAGSFHIVLTNQIGLQKTPFMADVTQDMEVWNQPIHSYSVRIVGYQAPSPGAAQGTVREAVVQTTMAYAVEVNPSDAPVGNRDQSKTYQYRLELNNDDEIIGGEWISADRPDFLWTQDRPQFRGYWQSLESLYNQSIGGAPTTPTPPVATPTPSITPTPTVTPIPPARTPTPTPTRTPTPAMGIPTPQPSNPGPIFVPFEPIDANWDTAGQFQCDSNQGWSLQGQRNSGAKVCSKEGMVQQETVTLQMKQSCQSQGGANCTSQSWSLQQFAKFRGNSFCSLGSNFDKETGYCLEQADLIGPFKRSLVEQCVKDQLAAGQSPSVCYSLRLKKEFVIQTLGQR